mmetsp:Transcript_62081/g.110752  ORF Transcript_62081/g.110752 Transcript_62081/m.110752 type:complete len:84 (+) Transcript_62081:327-578(+)
MNGLPPFNAFWSDGLPAVSMVSVLPAAVPVTMEKEEAWWTCLGNALKTSRCSNSDGMKAGPETLKILGGAASRLAEGSVRSTF